MGTKELTMDAIKWTFGCDTVEAAGIYKSAGPDFLNKLVNNYMSEIIMTQGK